MKNGVPSTFPYLHPETATVIGLQQDIAPNPQRLRVDVNSHGILVDGRDILQYQVGEPRLTTEDLIPLALDCDALVFGSEQPSVWRSDHGVVNDLVTYVLLQSCPESAICLACLAALNILESFIRGTSSNPKNLLKTILENSRASNVVVERLLLLATGGLNLRNLVWHGFLPNVPRPWLAVILVLISSYSACDLAKHTQDASLSVTSYGLAKLLPVESVSSFDGCTWVSESHKGLLELSNQLYEAAPVASSCLLVIIIEHGLRREWCRLNDLPEDSVAQHGRFYVTLDGHGQRQVHNLILGPAVKTFNNCTCTSKRNKLLSTLGASRTALLTDIFMSPTGPNIRSVLSHGFANEVLEKEIMMITRSSPTTNCPEAKELYKLLNFTLRSLHTSCAPFEYSPQFTYTKLTQQCASVIAKHLLTEVPKNVITKKYDLQVSSPEEVVALTSNVQSVVGLPRAVWDMESFWYEQDHLNPILAKSPALLSLGRDLSDILSGMSASIPDVEEFVGFACFLHMRTLQELCQQEGELTAGSIRLIERTRMALSTVKSQLPKNVARSVRAIELYSQNKLVCGLVASLRCENQ